MKRFSFRLQKLLDLARRREEEARSVMARKLGEVRNAETAVDQARERVREAFADMSASLGGTRIEPREIDLMQRWLARTEETQRRLEERLAKEELAFENARALMTERRRELLGYERGREKALDDWREVAGREEAAWMEEVASTRHQARRSES